MDKKYLIREYLTTVEKNPFREWINSLDLNIKAKIQARIFRFETGNLGDYKSVGKGVFGARLDFGPGYRLYFGLEGNNIILLLMGGDKRTQKRNITKAHQFWNNYQKEKKIGKKK